MLTFLIMAGGSGERFWPLSTKNKPKQLLKIFNDKTLIRIAYERILPLVDKQKIFIATNSIQLDELKKDLEEIEDSRIIIEPCFRDTAAAIAYGSTVISKYYDNPTICVLASDHLIANEEDFRKQILTAEEEANKNMIVTLGIRPTNPETGYGYIRVSDWLLGVPTKSLGFKEKPNFDIAKEYFKSGNYLWNSGMFIFKYDVIIESLRKYSYSHFEIISKINSMFQANKGITTSEIVKDVFSDFEKKSIDYAIMEKADNVSVIPVEFGWNDVGNYTAFDDIFEKDLEQNVSRNISYVSIDSKDNIIIGDGAVQRVSLIGVENKIIAITKTEILICDKHQNQDIKKLLRKIMEIESSEKNIY